MSGVHDTADDVPEETLNLLMAIWVFFLVMFFTTGLMIFSADRAQAGEIQSPVQSFSYPSSTLSTAVRHPLEIPANASASAVYSDVMMQAAADRSSTQRQTAGAPCLPPSVPLWQSMPADPSQGVDRNRRAAGLSSRERAVALGLIFGIRHALGPTEGQETPLQAVADTSMSPALAMAEYRRCKSQRYLDTLSSLEQRWRWSR